MTQRTLKIKEYFLNYTKTTIVYMYMYELNWSQVKGFDGHHFSKHNQNASFAKTSSPFSVDKMVKPGVKTPRVNYTKAQASILDLNANGIRTISLLRVALCWNPCFGYILC